MNTVQLNMSKDEIINEALRVIHAAEDSGSYGQEVAIGFIEKYPSVYNNWSEQYEEALSENKDITFKFEEN